MKDVDIIDDFSGIRIEEVLVELNMGLLLIELQMRHFHFLENH